MDLTYKIVRRLLRDRDVAFSRNKNFDAYDDKAVRRAVRIYRHLRSVELDLLAADDGAVQIDSVEQSAGRIVVKLSFPRSKGRRESYLTDEEWKLLVESEQVKDILDRRLASHGE